MSNGWKKIAALGPKGEGYPQILVDSHGWCLRLGPSARQDEKYYSSFSSLLGGLTEHVLRRRLKSTDVLQGLQDLVRAVDDAVRTARELSSTVQETVIHEHIRRCGALEARGLDPAATGHREPGKSADTLVRCESVATL